ncbi:deoxyribonuclease [Cellulomonas sp. PSBB021]|nr:deoxyribonuclease [Cellulomonas sp. PSBB021]
MHGWRRGRVRPVCAVAGLLAALTLAGCSDVSLGPSTQPAEPPPATASADPTASARGNAAPPPPTATTDPGPAVAALDRLVVAGRAPLTGYDRDLFGYRAVDADRNGCDTRNDILRRDLVDAVVRADGCVVLSGTLVDPYSGRTIAFERGAATSGAVQVDHVVALADAWQKGAQRWDGATREAFANDPLNLLAVDGTLNAAKGSGDAATWLPPARGSRCAYVARQVAVKQAYALRVTAAEHDAIARVLRSCPDEALSPPSPVTPRRATTGGAPTPPPAGSFASCADARAAGAAPLHAGDPGYRPGLDGDGDGIACE